MASPKVNQQPVLTFAIDGTVFYENLIEWRRMMLSGSMLSVFSPGPVRSVCSLICNTFGIGGADLATWRP